MRHAASELANRLHLLSLAKLLFPLTQGTLGRLAVSDVALDHDPVGAAAVAIGDRDEAQLDPVGRAVLAVVQQLGLERLAGVEGVAEAHQGRGVGLRAAEDV